MGHLRKDLKEAAGLRSKRRREEAAEQAEAAEAQRDLFNHPTCEELLAEKATWTGKAPPVFFSMCDLAKQQSGPFDIVGLFGERCVHA